MSTQRPSSASFIASLNLSLFAAFARAVAVAQGNAFNQQGAQMMGTIIGINENDKRSFG